MNKGKKTTDYSKLYKKAFKILGTLTPLKKDCGYLCGSACCRGDSNTGMRLFPNETTALPVRITENGDRLAVCNGSCNRDERPLACRIFPLFPTISENEKIYPEIDYRAYRLCPMVKHCEQILFNKKFIKAIRRVGKLISKDSLCKEFLMSSTQEIDLFYEFYR